MDVAKAAMQAIQHVAVGGTKAAATKPAATMQQAAPETHASSPRMAATREGGGAQQVWSHPHRNSHTTNPSPVCTIGKVFQAAQAHWLSACLHVMLDLHVADVLCKGAAGGDQAPAGADSSAADGPQQQQGMHIDQVRVLRLTAGLVHHSTFGTRC